ncbi:MAG: pilus assembly protein TadE, partial [Roseiflexus sp.]
PSSTPTRTNTPTPSNTPTNTLTPSATPTPQAISYTVTGSKRIDQSAPPGELADLRIRIVVRNSLGTPVPGVSFTIIVSGASPTTSWTGVSDNDGLIVICIADVYRARDNLDVTTDVTSPEYPDPGLDGRRITVQNGAVTCR